MSDDEDLKEGLKKSMSEPAKKKETGHTLESTYGTPRAWDLYQKLQIEERKKKDWESKFEKNKG